LQRDQIHGSASRKFGHTLTPRRSLHELSPGACTIKLFTTVINSTVKYSGRFVTVTLFHPSPIFPATDTDNINKTVTAEKSFTVHPLSRNRRAQPHRKKGNRFGIGGCRSNLRSKKLFHRRRAVPTRRRERRFKYLRQCGHLYSIPLGLTFVTSQRVDHQQL
jgi:hypothetical protein